MAHDIAIQSKEFIEMVNKAIRTYGDRYRAADGFEGFAQPISRVELEIRDLGYHVPACFERQLEKAGFRTEWKAEGIKPEGGYRRPRTAFVVFVQE